MVVMSLARIFLGALATAAMVTSVAAQDPAAGRLSLARARELAREASPELRAARAAVAAAAGRERQAAAHPNPALLVSHERTEREGARNSQIIAQVEQPLEVAGQPGARRNAARYRREASQADLDHLQAQVDLAVSRAYAGAFAGDRRVALADRMLAAFDQAVTLSERRLAAGDVSGFSHRRLQLEAARWAAARAQAALDRRSARLALAGLIAAQPDSVPALAQLPLDSVVVEPVTLGVDALRSQARARRADLRAARFLAAAADASVHVAARERIPVPVIAVGYKTEESAGLDERLNGFTLGFTLPLPVWNRRGGLVDAARAEARGREAEVAAVERRIAREVTEAYDAFQATERQRVALAPRLGAEADTALAAVEVAFAEGELTLVEWLDAQRAYHDASATYIALQAEAVTRRAELNRASGGALTAPTQEGIR
jgi:cobalt-zinc-cadmium efflux system outer membrane protein